MEGKRDRWRLRSWGMCAVRQQGQENLDIAGLGFKKKMYSRWRWVSQAVPGR